MTIIRRTTSDSVEATRRGNGTFRMMVSTVEHVREVSWQLLRDEVSRTTWRDWSHATAAVAGFFAFVILGAVLGRVFGALVGHAWLLAGLSAALLWSRARRRKRHFPVDLLTFASGCNRVTGPS